MSKQAEEPAASAILLDEYRGREQSSALKESLIMLIQLLQEQFSRSPDSLFVIEAETGLKLTYGEFSAAARDLAQTLSGLGINQSSRVGILLENCPEFLVTYLACIYIGATAVPINVQLGRKDRQFILENSGLAVLMYGQSTKSLIESFSITSVCVKGTAAEGLTWRLGEAAQRGLDLASFATFIQPPGQSPSINEFYLGHHRPAQKV